VSSSSSSCHMSMSRVTQVLHTSDTYMLSNFFICHVACASFLPTLSAASCYVLNTTLIVGQVCVQTYCPLLHPLQSTCWKVG
jgi:hypothetical protein